MRKFTSAVSVSVSAYPATPQFLLGDAARTKADVFTRYGLSLVWRTGATITYSFDGVTDHGNLEDALATEAMILDGVTIPLGAIWFKSSSGTSTLRVEVWDQP